MEYRNLARHFGMVALSGALVFGAQAASAETVDAAEGICKNLTASQTANPANDSVTIRWTNDKGQLNRHGGPAMVKCDAQSGHVLAEIWAINGSLHNPSGPAYKEYDPATKNLRVEAWWLNGKQTRAEGPVFTIRDPLTKIITTEEWKKDDLYFRSSGEATNLRRDPATGVVILEEWAEGRQGEDLHKVGSPAFMQRDPVTGVVVYEEWRQQDKFFRENDLPTRVWRNGATGKVTREEWKAGYILDRSSGPAVIQYAPDGATVQDTEYWKKGKRIEPAAPQSKP
ncbi:MAG: hypothetical protein HYS17_05855 [Micavibrio aeruginosavorus]|uniref:MORN repeat variant n=1 Tax=Micavibrio aeruginosavorus TaxID=349221 RepID=A0A7T5R4J4_9BACT|nr:MAG: hypothetical protein HYS17_05855 [Micavibrio aeruginosavorus]